MKGLEKLAEAESMSDLLNLTMLVAASAGSLAFGVLAAYGIFRAGFALIRPQQPSPAVKPRPEVANAS
jgi:hypothetical protein